MQYYNTASLYFKKEIALLDRESGPSSPVPHLQILDLNGGGKKYSTERPAYNQD